MKLSVVGIAIFLMTGPVVVADELDDTYQSLQDAVAKKDAAQVKKLAVPLFELSRKVIAAPEPTSAIEKEDWPNRVKYAKEAEGYAEYALYATGVQADAATMVDLLGLLERRVPRASTWTRVTRPTWRRSARWGRTLTSRPSWKKPS